MKDRHRLHAAILMAAALGAAFIPSIYKGIFLFGEVIEDPNNLFSFYPWNVFSASLFVASRFPLINPFNACGVPLLANLQSAPLYPLHLLLFIHPSKFGFDVFLIGRLFILGYGAYLLARRLGLNHFAAIGAMLAAAMNGYFMRYRAMVHLNVEILIPWAMLFALKVIEEKKLEDFSLLALIISCALIGGNAESSFFVVFTSFAFTAWILATERKNINKNAGLLVLGASALAMLPALAQLLPFFEYLPHAWHIHPSGAGSDWLNGAGVISLAAPDMFGGVAGFAPYLGASVIALGVIGAGRNARNFFFLVATFFFFALIYGIPGTKWLTALPVFNRIASYKYAFAPLAVTVAMLAGMGIDAAMRGEVTAGRIRRAAASVALFVGFFILGGVIAGREMNLVGSIAAIAALGVVASAPSIKRYGPAAIVIAVFLELFVHFHGLKPKTILDPMGFREDPAIMKISGDPAKGRVSALIESGFLPNLNLLYGIHDLNLFDALYPKSYVERISKIADFDYDNATAYFKTHAYSFPLSTDNAPESIPMGVVFFLLQDSLLMEVAEGPNPWTDGIPASISKPITSDYWRIDIPSGANISDKLSIKFNYLPGWRAWLNGSPVKIGNDSGFMSIPLMGGVKTVELRYTPVGFKIGLWSALASLVTLTFPFVVNILGKKEQER